MKDQIILSIKNRSTYYCDQQVTMKDDRQFLQVNVGHCHYDRRVVMKMTAGILKFIHTRPDMRLIENIIM